MSLGLLLPAGLAALAALLLPLLIHLSRQSEQRRTEFAALRWLSASLRPRQKLKFEELFLLLLRLLLLAALALLLARPVLLGAAGDARWVLVTPGVDVTAARTAIKQADAEWHWLAPGFPGVETPVPTAVQPIGSLLRELDATLPAKTPVTVFVPDVIDRADGERPRLARSLDWRVMAASASTAKAASPSPAPVLVIRNADSREPYLPYLRAAAAAWRVMDAPSTQSPANTAPPSPEKTVDVAPTAQPIAANTRWLAWLAPGPLPSSIREWIERGGIALLDAEVELPEAAQAVALWRNTDGDELVRGVAIGRGRALLLTRPLTPGALPELLDGDFPRQLRRLFKDESTPPQRALASAIKPIPGGPSFPETPRPLQSWFLVAVALLFALERWFASAARRRQTP